MSRVCIQSSAWLTQTLKRSTETNILSSMKLLGFFPPCLLASFVWFPGSWTWYPKFSTVPVILGRSCPSVAWISLSEQGGHRTFEICPNLHILFEARNRFFPLDLQMEPILLEPSSWLLVSRTIRKYISDVFMPPTFWPFVMTALGNCYSKLL